MFLSSSSCQEFPKNRVLVSVPGSSPACREERNGAANAKQDSQSAMSRSRGLTTESNQSHASPTLWPAGRTAFPCLGFLGCTSLNSVHPASNSYFPKAPTFRKNPKVPPPPQSRQVQPRTLRLDLQHDPTRPEDVLKVDCDDDGSGGDDAADALRYLVSTRLRMIYERKLTGL